MRTLKLYSVYEVLYYTVNTVIYNTVCVEIQL